MSDTLALIIAISLAVLAIVYKILINKGSDE